MLLYTQKKRYKSCHLFKRYTFVPKGCTLVPLWYH